MLASANSRKTLLAGAALAVAVIGAFALRPVVHRFRLAQLIEQMRAAETSYHAGLARTLAVSSEGVGADGRMADAFTCRGEGKSPPFAWSGAPAAAQSFVAIIVDSDAATPRPHVWALAHWILYDIPRDQTSIEAGIGEAGLRPRGIETADNALGGRGYLAPCSMSEERHYLIRVYALDVPAIRPGTSDRQGINDAMKGHILSFGEVQARAGNWPAR